MAVELSAAAAPGVRVPVPGCLRYRSADPYAVHLDCIVGAEMPIRWTFARDLLAAGVHIWAGIGDVSVFPAPDGAESNVCIALDSGTGAALLLVPTVRVTTFLAHTARIVPFGAEWRYLDLDALVHRLCGGDESAPPGP